MTTLDLPGIKHELTFWQSFVKTDRFLKGWVADIKTPELNQFVYEFILQKFYSGFKILDVGSGVVSILNGTIPKEHIVSADPLGGLYEIIFDYKKHNIQPPVAVPAEELNYENEFDIVHCSNALDHCQYPITAYYKLLSSCKPGGYLILQGFENEGEFENYSGFHQWNIHISPHKHLVIANKTGVVEVFESSVHAETVTFIDGKKWFIWIAQK